MRKLFLLVAAVLLTTLAPKADTIDFSWAQIFHASSGSLTELEFDTPYSQPDIEGLTVTLSNGGNADVVKSTCNQSGMFLAKKGTKITFKSTRGNMTKINLGNFAKSYSGLNSMSENSPSTGKMSIEKNAIGKDVLAWNGDAAEVTLNVDGMMGYLNELHITFTGAPVVEVPEDGTLEHPFTITSLAEMSTRYKYYRYKGNALVTFSYADSPQAYYIEDESGAIGMKNGLGTDNVQKFMSLFKAGDKISNLLLYCNRVKEGQLSDANATVLSSGNPVEPKVVSLADFPTNYSAAWDGAYRLVKVEGVTSPNAGSVFSVYNTENFNLTQGDVTRNNILTFFAGSDVEGKAVPSGKMNVTGIADYGYLLKLRNMADIEEVPDVVPEDGTLAHPFTITSIANITSLNSGKYYKYTGEGVLVTYVGTVGGTRPGCYVQSSDGAVKLWLDDQGLGVDLVSKLKVGDKITNFVGSYRNYAFALCKASGNVEGCYDLVSAGNEVEPTIITLSDNFDNYRCRLVKLNGLTVPDPDGKTLQAGSSSGLTVKQGDVEKQNVLNAFAGTDAADAAAPVGEFNLTGIRDYSSNIYVRSLADIEKVVVDVPEDGTLEHPFTITSLAEMKTKNTYYRYKGEAIVTFRSWAATPYLYYMQDESAAICLRNGVETAGADGSFLNLFREGDKVTDILIGFYRPNEAKLYDLTASVTYGDGTPIAPKVVSLADFKTNSDIAYRLVKVEGVTSKNAGSVFTDPYTCYNLTQGDVSKDEVLGFFEGTDLANKAVPSGKMDITGIAVYGYQLKPRSTADIVVTEEVKTPVLSTFRTMPTGALMPATSINLSGYAPMVKTIVVKGTDLKGDITLTCTEGLTADKTTITKAEAEAENGCAVNVTVAPAESGKFSGTVTFKSEGAADAVFTLATSDWSTVTVIKEVTSLEDVIGKVGAYNVKDVELTVTYCQWNKDYTMYAQNDQYAMPLYIGAISYGAPESIILKEGMTIKNFFLVVREPSEWEPNWTYEIQGTDANGAPATSGTPSHYYDIVATDVVVTPKAVALNELKDNAYRLVTVNDVTFKDVAEGAKFEKTQADYSVEPTPYAVVSGTQDGTVLPLVHSDIYGTEIPTEAVNVTGIAADAENTIMPRSTKDFGSTVLPDPEFTVAVEKLVLSGAMPMKRSVKVIGKYIAGNVTVECPEGVTADPATIEGSALTAAGNDGVEVAFIFDTAADFSGSIKFVVPGMENPVELPISCVNVTVPEKAATLAEVAALGVDKTVLYTGEAIVTQVIKDASGQVEDFWMQDATGGVEVNTLGLTIMGQTFPQVEIGDKVTNVNLSTLENNAALIGGGMKEYLTIVSNGNTVEPMLITETSGFNESTRNMLVCVRGVKFTTGGDFKSNTTYTVKGGKVQADVTPFAPVVGTAIPANRVDITGIYGVSVTGGKVIYSLRPRTTADITESTMTSNPTVLVTEETYETDPVKMGEKVLLATYKVEVEDLEADGAVKFTGEAAAIFSAEPAVIDKADGETMVNIYVTGEKIGIYEAAVEFDFGKEELNSTFDLKARVYDAANLPTVTLNEYKVDLYAKTGSEATRKLTLTMANCFEPVVIKAKDAANTEVTISPMTIEPTTELVELTLTFKPTADGKGLQQFDITTPMIKTEVVLLVNTSTDLDGVAMVVADANGFYHVYTAAGMLVMRTADAQDLRTLAPGLYIINGRKYMLR